MKNFTLHKNEFQAEDFIDGILFNPILPDNFWTATVTAIKLRKKLFKNNVF